MRFAGKVATLLPQSCLFLLVNKEASKYSIIRSGQEHRILKWLIPGKKLYFLISFCLFTKLYGCISEQCTCILGKKQPTKTQNKSRKACGLVLTVVYILQAFKHLHPIPWFSPTETVSSKRLSGLVPLTLPSTLHPILFHYKYFILFCWSKHLHD